MCKKYFIYLLTPYFFCGFSQTLMSQESDRIQIKHADFGDIDKKEGMLKQTFLRGEKKQVHFVHKGIDMFCDRAVYYPNKDKLESYGKVKMNQGDTLFLSGDYMEYKGESQRAAVFGNVMLKDPTSTLTTDTLYYDRIKQQAFYPRGGKVVKDSSGIITSRVGRHYLDKRKYVFTQQVRLVNEKYQIDTERLDFYTEKGLAFFYGPTTLHSEKAVVYCEKGFYNTEQDKGYFLQHARVDHKDRILEGDSIFFDRQRGFASATNHIKLTDSTNQSVVKGHYAELYQNRDSVFVTKRALAITVREHDSIYLHSDTLLITGPPKHRITRAFRGAIMYKSDMSGRADSIHVDEQTGIAQFINLNLPQNSFAKKRQPVLWNMGSQMTGDTIVLKYNPETEKLDSLLVFDRAFLINRDTLGDGFNQISGQKLYGLFNRENELYHVDIVKNSQVIFYARNDKKELIGINKSKSSNISIELEGKGIEEIRLIKQIDGDLFPESKYPKNQRLLRGFNWREEEQPKSVLDLFKDDPPLDLPIIKGIVAPDEELPFFENPKPKETPTKRSIEKSITAPPPQEKLKKNKSWQPSRVDKKNIPRSRLKKRLEKKEKTKD